VIPIQEESLVNYTAVVILAESDVRRWGLTTYAIWSRDLFRKSFDFNYSTLGILASLLASCAIAFLEMIEGWTFAKSSLSSPGPKFVGMSQCAAKVVPPASDSDILYASNLELEGNFVQGRVA